MRVTISGATGLIGSTITRRLLERGDEVTVLSRDPEKAKAKLGNVAAHAWDLKTEPAPTAALEGRDAVVHLAGENVGQRWNAQIKEEIMESRRLGTRNLVAALRDAGDARPRTLVSSSASGFYGPHGAERVDEHAPAGDDWLAQVCVAWETEADAAQELGMRVAKVRTGVVLDESDGALAKMLPPFKLGVGGPVAGGKQYLPWIHVDDIAGLYVAVLDHPTFKGVVNGSAPEPVDNKTFSKALGKVLGRPSFSPVPAFAIKTLYGEMATIVVNGVNMVPGRAEELGYSFTHPQLEGALRATLGR
jgi:uncharacterized protein (TIGR01777 family)